MFINTSNNIFVGTKYLSVARTIISYCGIVFSIVVIRLIYLIVHCNTFFVIKYWNDISLFRELLFFSLFFSLGIWFDSTWAEIVSTRFQAKLFRIWDIWKFWIWLKMKFQKLKPEISEVIFFIQIVKSYETNLILKSIHKS